MQEHEIQQDMDRLTDEKEELEQKKQDLQDPKKLEQKARDELGLVKPGKCRTSSRMLRTYYAKYTLVYYH